MSDLDTMSDAQLLGLYQQLKGGKAPTAASMKAPAAAAGWNATLQGQENADLDAYHTASGINARMRPTRDMIERGDLNLGPVANVVSQARNFVGWSDPNSKNFASFRANLEKMRNDSLRLNKGVQTEGDAVRAWNELLSNLNDEGVVKQRLAEIEEINGQAMQLRRATVNNRRQTYGLAPPDFGQFEVKGSNPLGALGAQGHMRPNGRAMAADNARSRQMAGQRPELADARRAIARGADRAAVIDRLRKNGIDPAGL